MKEKITGCDSIVQSVIDNHINNSNIKFILCGSYVDTMKDLIEGTVGALIGLFWAAFYRNGIIGPNRKERRKAVKERSRSDRREELELLGIEDIKKYRD